ncbi:MAG: hypothetical protein AB7K52_06270 [Phycisphaerales bacterium]
MSLRPDPTDPADMSPDERLDEIGRMTVDALTHEMAQIASGREVAVDPEVRLHERHCVVHRSCRLIRACSER